MRPPPEPSPDCFRALVERSWDAVTLLDAAGTVLYVTPSVARVLGYTPAELLGQSALALVHPDDRPAAGRQFAELLAAPGRTFTSCYRCRHKDGSWRWLEGTRTNLLGDPSVGAIVAQDRDVGERRQAEDSRRWLAALVDSSEDAIISKTLDGTITSWNGGAERLYGYRAEELVGKSISLLIPADRPDELPGILRRLRAGERIEPYETLRRRKDGSLVEVSVSVSPIRDLAGRVIGASSIARDVAAQKRLQEELRGRAEALAEADRRKDDFLHMLAHELRNPLAPIFNGLEILRLAGADAERRQQAGRMMERQVRHLTRLVDDLLDVARISRGKVRLRRERLDLARLVRGTAEDHRPSLDRAGLALTVAAPDTPVWVSGDGTRLAQVVGNLLDNAAKFTDRGGRVRVAVEADRPARRAEVHVTDTGQGIAPDLLGRLFEPFSQGDRSLNRAPGGLGLGLALVRGLTELHGGEVEVRSGGPGRGAEFIVRLPVEQEPAALTGPAAAPRPGGGRLRILVVEDNRDAAETLRVWLGILGHEVEVAHTGPEGVEAARRRPPEVVLCDIGLPGLDGYGVARAIRQDATTAGARLIAITGYGSDEDRRRSQDAGFDLHLTKPVDPADLQPLLTSRGAGL
jgi:PAS domain S-box-containing protein